MTEVPGGDRDLVEQILDDGQGVEGAPEQPVELQRGARVAANAPWTGPAGQRTAEPSRLA